MIIRRKFEHVYLFPEYHWDTGPPHGTAKPFVKIGGPVEDDATREALDEVDANVLHAEFMNRTREFIDKTAP